MWEIHSRYSRLLGWKVEKYVNSGLRSWLNWKVFPCKHENLSSVPKTYIKIWARWCMFVIPGLEQCRQADPWKRAEQKAWPISKFQVMGYPVSESVESNLQMSLWHLHTGTWTHSCASILHIQTCMHAHTIEKGGRGRAKRGGGRGRG